MVVNGITRDKSTYSKGAPSCVGWNGTWERQHQQNFTQAKRLESHHFHPDTLQLMVQKSGALQKVEVRFSWNPHDFTRFSTWVFPKIGGKPPKWMVYNGKPYFLMDDLGGKPTIFGNIHIQTVGCFAGFLNPSTTSVTGDPTARPHLNQIVDEVKARFHRDDLTGFFFTPDRV